MSISSHRFGQNQLDEPIASIAKFIPYPVDRQVHSIVVLSHGGTEEHVDDLSDFLATAYCIPFHLPKNTRLWQRNQHVVMQTGACYSFSQADYHAVDVPDSCRTYSAFVIVDILEPWLYKKTLARRQSAA